MKKMTSVGSFLNRMQMTKRWLGLLAFCAMLFTGQLSFASAPSADSNDVCSQISESSSTGLAWALAGATNQSLAVDFIVFDGVTFDINEIKVNVSGSPTYFNVIFLSDNNGLPGTVISQYTNVLIAGSTPIGGFTQYTLDISSENASFSSSGGDLKYWMQIQSDATGWENRVGSQIGGNDAFLNDNSLGWAIINTDTGNNDLVYELIGECTGSSCLPPTAPTAVINSSSSVTLGWVSDGALFDVEWGTSGFALGTGTQINSIAANSTDVTVSIGVAYEFYVRQNCGVDGESSWIGPFSFQTGYCTPAYTNGCAGGAKITNFETSDAILNIANNTGTATCGIQGYDDFSYLSLAATEDMTVSFAVGIGDYWAAVKIWVDWNNNGVFEASELVSESVDTVQSGTDYTGSFTIPVGQALGDYRLRVRIVESTTTYDACSSQTWGETEDYTLSVITPPSCMPPAQLGANINSLTEAELYWTSDGTLFEVEYGMQGFTLGTGTSVTGITTNNTIVSGLTQNTYYHYYVRRDCGDGDLSIWAGPYTFYTNYCEATTQWTGDNISGFETSGAIVNISNTNNGSAPTGYADFTSFAVQHFETGEAELIVTTQYSMNVNIWIDWNNNMVFDTDELVFEGLNQQNIHTALITVPAGTPLGDYRIRIRAGYTWATGWGSACGTINYGETEDYTFTVITPPTCMPPTQLGANINSLTEAELYWTSDGTLFEVEYGMQGFTLGTGTSVTGITTNDTTLTGLTPNAYYHYFVRRDCGDGDLSPWTGPYTFYTNYCEATTQWEWDYINGFETSGGITNISNNNTGFSYPNGYGDYTAMSASHFETGEVSFTLTTPSWLGVNIWIDWNNNMVFEESEKVYTSGDWTMQGPFTGMFSVPVGQALGDYRMRVRGSNDSGNPLPCGQINYGETEDYTFTVIDTPTCMPPTQLGANINSLTEAELYWTSDGTLFEVEYGMQGFDLGTGTSVTGITTNNTIVSGLTPNTYHHYYVRRDCGDGDLSPWTGPYTFYTNYCESTTQWEWDYINGFETSGGITNISNNNTGFSYPNGYGDYTAMSASHFETGEVSFTLTTPSWLGVNIWIDWNNNMVFEESEKVYTSGDWTMQGPFTGMFSVPVGQALGDYRMRVRGSNDSGNPSPCGQINYGETEDYTFTVIETPTCMPPTQLGANINSLTEAELYWTSDGTLFEVEYGMQGFDLGTGTSVTGITTNNTIVSGLTQNTYHHYYVRRDCGDGDLSPWTGPYTFYTNYCEVSTQWTGDNISGFETSGAIVNISNTNNGSAPTGYADFTSFSVQHFETGETELIVTTQYSMNVNIWIDWNNNMVFDAGELVFEGLNQQNVHTATITVPAGTPLGDYRIRIRAGYTWDSNFGGPCGTINYGETEDYTFTVITPPTCMPPTQLGANINSLTEAELYWTSDGTLFEVEYGMQGFTLGTGTSVTGITTNDTTLTGLTPNTYHHYFVRRDCGDGDLSPWTGPYLFYTNYCEATSQWTGDNINSVETSGAIVNISNVTNGASPNGYGNFTNYAVQHFETGETEFTVTTNWSMSVNIWIDWNSNMIFDAGELVYQSTMQQQTHTALISVPVGTPIGDYRIRVRAQWNSPPACGTINYGETEDYTFTVITPPTCMPPTQLGANINSLTEAELYWTSDGTLFEVEYGMQGFTLGTGTQVTGITANNTILSGLTQNTYYQYFIRRDCGDGDLSPWTGPYTFYTNYCEVGVNWTGDNITSFVTTGGIPYDISNTGTAGSAGGYGDYTSMSVHHFETGQIDFTVTTNWDMNVKIWIDWNSNMVFDTDELVATFTGSNTYTGSFLIPLGTPVGDYRIRIRGSWDSNFGPCGITSGGETEDYTLTVITPPSCLPAFQPTTTNVSATSTALSWQSDGDLFDIEYGPAGFTQGDGTTISGVGNPYVLSGLTGGVAYDYYVRQDCGDDDGYSTWNGPVTFIPGVFDGDISSMFNANPQVTDDACEASFSIDVPEGYYLSSLNVEYVMMSWNTALVSQQRSVLYSPTLNMGEAEVVAGVTEFPGMGMYDREVTFANGATGTIEFQLKAWRTANGSGCNEDYVYVMDGSWVLDAEFELIPTCPEPTDLAYTNPTADSVDLVWMAAVDADPDSTFDIQWGLPGFDPEDNEGTTISELTATSHTLSGLDSSIVYEFYVRSNCSTDDEDDFSAWIGPIKFNAGHCIPSSQYTHYITTFLTTDAEDNIAYYSTAINGSGYGDKTDFVVSQLPGESFDFSLNYVGGQSGLRIWVDWNNDFVFGDDEEMYYFGNASGTKTGSISIPSDAAPGNYVMRVRTEFGATAIPSACGHIEYGEALDFTLNVATVCDEVATPTADSPQLLSEGQTVADIVVTDVTGTLNWYSDEDLTVVVEETDVLAEGVYTFWVTQTVDGCESDAIEIMVEVSLSRNAFDEASFRAYPNPVTELLNISYSKDITDVSVINMLGQIVISQTVSSTDTQVDMSALPTGSYLVKVTVDGAVKTIKVVKQ